MRFLVSPDAACQGLAAALDADQVWPGVLDLCERWRVLPALAARLAAGRHALPPAEAARLRLAVVEQMVTTSRRLRSASAALQALDTAGISAAAFKGAAVLALLHPGSVARSLGDVDVLVHPEDAARAVDVLRARGFHAKVGEVDAAEYLAFVRASPGAAGNEAISLADADGTDIDLHWKLGAFDTARLLAAAVQAPLAGAMVKVLSPADGLCLTAHHALRNDLVPDEIARDLLDAQGWFRLLGGAAPASAPAGIPEAIEALRGILLRLGATDMAPTAMPITAAERLAALYLRQLATGPMNTDLPYVVSVRAIAQVLRGAWRDWRHYEAMMHTFERVNGEASTSVRHRMARLAASAWHTAPAQWRQLRTLARLKDRIA